VSNGSGHQVGRLREDSKCPSDAARDDGLRETVSCRFDSPLGHDLSGCVTEESAGGREVAFRPPEWDDRSHQIVDGWLMEHYTPFEQPPLHAFLLSDESAEFHGALVELRLGLEAGAAVGDLPDPSSLAGPGEVLMSTAARFLEAAADQWQAPMVWQTAGEEIDLDALAYRGRAAGLMVLGGLFAAGEAGDPYRLLEDMTRIAYGMDPTSTLLGDLFSDHPLGLDPEILPPPLVGFDELLRRTCMTGVLHAGAAFGRVASQRPRPFAGAQITDVDPGSGCAGDEITLRGNGFGDPQPSGVSVMFSSRGGGCVVANVVVREGQPAWSDTEIVVKVPEGVGHGCIGLIEQPPGFEEIGAAAEEFAGELTTCLGPAAMHAAEQIRASSVKVMAAACPDCDDPGTYPFAGGPPMIRRFAGNGWDSVEIMPGADVTVAWEVAGADDVVIVAVGKVLPDVPGPQDPSSGEELIEDIELPDGTVGSWRIAATNRCGTVFATIWVVVSGKRALVLSGGGAKGAFEVGVVRCLRDAAGIEFDIISGASAGALNAAKLAEGIPALAQLEQVWLGMRWSDDLYLEPAWFKTLEAPLRAVLTAGSSNLGFEAARFVTSKAWDKLAGSLVSAIGMPGIVYSIFTSLHPVITGVIDLVKYYNAIRQALAAPSLFQFTPTAQKIDANIDPAKVAASGIELRITAVALQTGIAKVFDQTGRELESGWQVPLREAVKASASIPIAFPPVPLAPGPHGTEHYVDGGVRDNTPIAAAVEAGAHRVYAVLLNPSATSEAGGITPQNMIQVAGRTVEMFLHEAQVNDVSPFQGFGVPTTVIAPTFLVHDTLQVDPGLISINMSYGYMRAYDEVVADPATAVAMRKLSDEITVARVEIWSVEHHANGHRLTIGGSTNWVPDPISLQHARTLKLALRAKVYQRINASSPQSVPSGRAAWWQQWERHPWTPYINTPWDAMSSKAGTLSAAPIPPP
jgi:NTE family protein